MIQAQNIRSLTEFREHAKEHLDRLAESGGVEVLTVNGQARGVVMSPAAYDRLAELARQSEVTAGIRRGLAEIASGQGVEGREALRALADDLDIRLDR